MLSHTQQSLLRKLLSRKHRWREGLFIAEGRKVVKDLLAAGMIPKFLVAEEDSPWPPDITVFLNSAELKKWSQLETADEVLGVFPFPEAKDNLSSEIVLILDEIRDPGNLGTILRTCDWFGVKQVICTKGTTDVLNSKSVQGSMGSIARVNVRYANAKEIISELADTRKIYCADMQGVPLNELKPQYPLALVLGSETRGPSQIWKEHGEAITIPSKGEAESLNVAIAGAVILGKLCLGDL
jgi:TrmH family RNA methyltransferase